jgi:hypothetical protein
MGQPVQGVIPKWEGLILPHTDLVTLVTLVSAQPFVALTSNRKQVNSRQEGQLHVWRGFLDAQWIVNQSGYALSYRLDTEFRIPRGYRLLKPIYLIRYVGGAYDTGTLALFAAVIFFLGVLLI